MRGYLADFKRYTPLLMDLTSRDIKVKYRRSVLGLAWSILNPLLTMIVLTQVFGYLLKIQVPDFPVFYIVGSSLFNFFSEATSSSMSSIIGASSLIKKVYIPKYIFPMEKCLFSLVNLLFSLIAVVIVMFFQGMVPTWRVILFFVPILYTLVFAIGMSFILSALTVFFRDILHLYGVIITLWTYLTPIIYPVSLLKSASEVGGIAGNTLWTIVNLNPLYHYVEYFRAVVMNNADYGFVPGLRENLICAGSALFVLVVGALVFKKAQDRFILHI